ncbi:MAG: autotransporter domain-containing protein, partial [Pseudomonadota bacterium]
SVRVHYAGMFLDGYTESGVDTPLTVDDRDIHILGGRAQLAAPYEQLGADGAVFRFEGRVGVDAQFNIGDSDVETTVAGLPLNFTATFDDEIVSGFVGGSLARTSEDGSGFFKASTEVHFASDGSYELRGNLNAVWNF